MKGNNNYITFLYGLNIRVKQKTVNSCLFSSFKNWYIKIQSFKISDWWQDWRLTVWPRNKWNSPEFLRPRKEDCHNKLSTMLICFDIRGIVYYRLLYPKHTVHSSIVPSNFLMLLWACLSRNTKYLDTQAVLYHDNASSYMTLLSCDFGQMNYHCWNIHLLGFCLYVKQCFRHGGHVGMHVHGQKVETLAKGLVKYV